MNHQSEYSTINFDQLSTDSIFSVSNFQQISKFICTECQKVRNCELKDEIKGQFSEDIEKILLSIAQTATCRAAFFANCSSSILNTENHSIIQLCASYAETDMMFVKDEFAKLYAKILKSFLREEFTGKHSATVIFFHGSVFKGDSGNNLLHWIRYLLGRNLEIPHVKFLFPTAPVQSYTPLNGEYSNVWFDRKQISIDAQECRKSLSNIYETVNELLSREINGCGIASNRIVVGGFSMGGALAMHTGYHLNTNLAGVFALSSFLNRESIVYESLDHHDSSVPLPPLKMFHGERDNLVPIEWAIRTFNELKKRGITGDFTSLPNTLHELKKSEMLSIEKWLKEILPPLESDLN